MIENIISENKANVSNIHNYHIFKRLLGIICFDQLAMTLTVPLITIIFFDANSHLFPKDASLATRGAWYGLVNALPHAINIFFSPLLSALSDVYGRKIILLLEIGGGTLFVLLLALAVYFASIQLILLAFLIRGTVARSNPTALAIIGDLARPEQKIISMAYLQFAISIGATLGPMIAGYLCVFNVFFATLNYSFVFFVVACFAFFNLFFVAKYIPETLQQKISLSKVYHHACKQTIFHTEVLRISCVLFLIQLAWSTYYQFLPPLLKTSFQFDSHKLGIFIGMIGFWLAFASSYGIKWLRIFCSDKQVLMSGSYLIFFGLTITLLALCGVLAIDSTTLLWLSAIPVALGDVAYFISFCIINYPLYSYPITKKAPAEIRAFCTLNPKIQAYRSRELQQIVDEDQSERTNFFNFKDSDMLKMRINDQTRRKRVGEIYGEGCFKSDKDYYNAALVFQHGEVPDHFYQAYIWFKKAHELGNVQAKQLMALAIDRYLVSIGHKQIFGSQFQKINDKCMCFEPIESSVTEDFRKKFSGFTLSEKHNEMSMVLDQKGCPKTECKTVLKSTPKGTFLGVW